MDDALEVQGEALPETDVSHETEVTAESPETVEQPEESAPSETEDDAPAKPKKKGVQERINELVRQREEAAREAAEYRAKLEAIQKPKPAEPTGRPSVDQFDSYEAYLEALSDWKVEQRLSTTQQVQRQEAQRRELDAKRQAFQERVDAFEAEDFAEVAYNPSLPISDAMRDVILESDQGPAILYHLGNNPADAKRIAAMSPVQAARELGRLEAKLSLPPVKTVTKAPPPITPIRGSGEPSLKDPDKMTPDEWREWRWAQQQGR